MVIQELNGRLMSFRPRRFRRLLRLLRALQPRRDVRCAMEPACR